METTILGRTGRRVSRIGFGGATAGLKNYIHPFDPANPDDRQPIIEAIAKAVELGINYFDVAEGYGKGAAEEIFGEALEPFQSEGIFVATKVGVWKNETVRPSLEASLKRLRLDSLDLLQIHGTVYLEAHVEKVLGKGGFLDEMEALRDEGLIKHIGFTCEASNGALYQFIHTGRFDVIQMCYNLMFQHPYDPGWKSGCFYDAKEQDMGIAVMRSTTSGIFQRWIQMVNQENTFDYTPALIQYQLSNPMIDVALIGMRSPQRVIDNVRIAEDMDARVDIEALFKRYV